MSLLEGPEKRKMVKRIVSVCILTLLGLAVAEVILLIFGEQVEAVYYGSKDLAFAPVYNRQGTWFHGRMGIGYRPGLQTAENIITLCMAWYLYRFMSWMNEAMGVSDRWLLGLDFGTAVTIARLITVLRGRLTLDYIYIRRFGSTYDLLDFYIGICYIILIIWIVVCEIRYLRVRKRETVGMNFWQKMKWACVFTGNVARAPFIPRKNWGKLMEKYRYE